MNRPMNRWIEALSHLRYCLRFRICLSHDQHEHNSECELLVPVFLHGLVISAASGTVLTVSPSANLRGACRSSKCLAVCFIELLIFGPFKPLPLGVAQNQEPITWSLHLPYKPLESALSDEKLFIEIAFAEYFSRLLSNIQSEQSYDHTSHAESQKRDLRCCQQWR